MKINRNVFRSSLSNAPGVTQQHVGECLCWARQRRLLPSHLRRMWLWDVMFGGALLDGKSDEELAFLALHVPQVDNMGCGVACAQMVLRFCGVDQQLLDHLPMPCWTIDLYLFLREVGLDATMHTLVAGMNPDNEGLAWYAQHLSSSTDVARCHQQFNSARTKGWEVEERSTSLAEVSARVAQHDTISICLVDGNRLNQQQHLQQQHSISFAGFAGHFVVLVHFEESTGCFWCIDPAQQRDPHIRTFDKNFFEFARCAPGTDQDIIFIRSSAMTTVGTA